MADITKIALVLTQASSRTYFFLNLCSDNKHIHCHYNEDDRVFCCILINVILQCHIQKWIYLIVCPHIWLPVELPHCCCWWAFSGNCFVVHIARQPAYVAACGASPPPSLICTSASALHEVLCCTLGTLHPLLRVGVGSLQKEDEFDALVRPLRDMDEGKNFKYFPILASHFDRWVGLVISTTSYFTPV